MSGLWAEDFAACGNRRCERLVRKGTLYCCTPCNFADGNSPTREIHEIHEHSEGCDVRWEERRVLVRARKMPKGWKP